ncbi:unnamed protein product [Calypogeia fissa]
MDVQSGHCFLTTLVSWQEPQQRLQLLLSVLLLPYIRSREKASAGYPLKDLTGQTGSRFEDDERFCTEGISVATRCAH